MTAIKVENISKTYGKQAVLDQLSFEVEENTICGFLGLNGAGKTTTFKLLNGLIEADSGAIEIFGQKIDRKNTSQDVKFLQDVPEFYAYMTAREYLKFICDLNGIANSKEKITETLELVGLSDAKNKRIGKFSRGMKQRIGIASTIIANPKVLMLDEPVSALDPIGRKEVFDLLESLKGKMTILFSTHIIEDVERVSDKIVMIHKGKKMLDGSISQMKEHFISNLLEIQFNKLEDMETFAAAFTQFSQEKQEARNILTLTTDTVEDTQLAIFNYLNAKKMTVASIKQVRPSLEEIFVNEVSDQ